MSLKRSKSLTNVTSLSKSPSRIPSKQPAPFLLTGKDLDRFFSPVIPQQNTMPRKKSPKSPPSKSLKSSSKKQSLVALKALQENIRKIRLQITDLENRKKEEIKKRVTDRNFTDNELIKELTNVINVHYNPSLLKLNEMLVKKLAKLQQFKFTPKKSI
jgi:hypothetical protein